MSHIQHPSKQQVRDFMLQRQSDPRPLPDIKEIRRQLGWELIAAQRECHKK